MLTRPLVTPPRPPAPRLRADCLGGREGQSGGCQGCRSLSPRGHVYRGSCAHRRWHPAGKAARHRQGSIRWLFGSPTSGGIVLSVSQRSAGPPRSANATAESSPAEPLATVGETILAGATRMPPTAAATLNLGGLLWGSGDREVIRLPLTMWKEHQAESKYPQKL